jgi:hypothetical protein
LVGCFPFLIITLTECCYNIQEADMGFQLIDYSEYYFQELSGEPIPESRGGKFVQLKNQDNDTEIIVLSPAKLSKYHANIVERFCGLNNLDGHWDSGKTCYELVDVAWSVVGGGKWEINTDKKTLELGSASQAYGSFNSSGLKNKISSVESMKDYLVRIHGS